MQLLYADESVETHGNMCAAGSVQHDLGSPALGATRKIYEQLVDKFRKKRKDSSSNLQGK